jgi:flagellar hook-length control protein FliK
MGGANSAVSMVTAYMTQGTAANVSNVSGQKNSSLAATKNFDNILNKVSDTFVQKKQVDVSRDVNKQLEGAKQTTNDGNSVGLNDAANSTKRVNEKASEAEMVTETKTSVVNETGNTEVDEKLQEAINEAGEEIISQIAETFDISEEEIVNAMEILGLMAVDLLDPANLTQLVTEIQGQGEVIDLITDSDIYTSLQDLMEGAESMKSELMNEFDLSEEGLQAAIQDTKENFGKQLENLSEEEPEVVINDNRQAILKEMAPKESLTPQSEAFTESSLSDDEPAPITAQQTSQSGNRDASSKGDQPLNLFNQVMNNITDAAVDVENTQAMSYTDRAQMENIIRQITEKITISAGPEETSMELALHPASLGHVNILLTSTKDGIVAKFTAQNELVKEAVETQMMQLQQKFNEQGIKVTSVEVTIASHSFEQNLEQGNDRQPSETGESKKVKALRRINLADLEEEEVEEIDSDAERIAVQMMAANGNSVDFSA